MITHFADIELQTLSIEGVKQVYADILQFPIAKQTETFIRFQVTHFTTISFKEILEPIVPTHFAFQVPYSLFDEIALWLTQSGVQILKDKQGEKVTYHSKVSKAVYFKDSDGNILEIISHEYVQEEVLQRNGPLQVMYVREVGFPVPSVPMFREWLKNTLQMKTMHDQDIFNFVIGGTAHAVVVKEGRPWIPIDMGALMPKMNITFGTPDLEFIQNVNKKEDTIQFVQHSYSITLKYTPEFLTTIPNQLHLPLSYVK
ncbi:VOC family protein [Bacillus sp. WLY-B-L8]|uniref:VOC family protein n=1 Tax=Bacillus multifaciens TaxID=3068506 RepID=UPI0027409893|nr:glyoxalase/bleomycin resistance/dioxygenase family protein [Bacillus sp. WLY-B-L8]MDP7978088.1 glyoxalase/bleomycin resistance/dioxygenase family protein [Bacillus sp. WLY-B-L8]